MYVVFGLILAWAIFISIYAWKIRKRVLLQEKKAKFYYETNEWFNGKDGVRYANNDEEMDSLLYLPEESKVFWFKGRKCADVQPNGSFMLKFPNGGRLNGMVHHGDKHIELVGLMGTAEDGVTENMILKE